MGVGTDFPGAKSDELVQLIHTVLALDHRYCSGHKHRAAKERPACQKV